MAKNRRIPFGYQMKNGEIVTQPRELYAVSKIFADYLKGKSLLEISRSMQEEQIPYHPGEDFSWNKNMVKRILENEKYLGTETYPQLISADIFHRANNKKINFCLNVSPLWQAIHICMLKLSPPYTSAFAFWEEPPAKPRWQSAHSTPAAACTPWWNTTCSGNSGSCSQGYAGAAASAESSFSIPGFSVSGKRWQSMQSAFAGIYARAADAAPVWHAVQAKPIESP